MTILITKDEHKALKVDLKRWQRRAAGGPEPRKLEACEICYLDTMFAKEVRNLPSSPEIKCCELCVYVLQHGRRNGFGCITPYVKWSAASEKRKPKLAQKCLDLIETILATAEIITKKEAMRLIIQEK